MDEKEQSVVPQSEASEAIKKVVNPLAILLGLPERSSAAYEKIFPTKRRERRVYNSPTPEQKKAKDKKRNKRKMTKASRKKNRRK